MKKLTRTLKLVFVNVIFFVFLLELISVVIYFFNHKAFFYSHKRIVQELIEFNVGMQVTDKRFHPFFGYTHEIDSKNRNNYGFNCIYDYPFKKEKREWFIIGIFGGSVANDFYENGREQLTKKLRNYAYYANREIIYLNYALGGYKQPQQMQILTYFLSIGQELDMAINIDGFNEVIFSFNNNRLDVDIAMPSAQHFLPMKDLIDAQAITVDKLESIWKIQGYKIKYNRIKKKMDRTEFASIYLILSSYNKYLYKLYRKELVNFDSLIKPMTPGESIVNIKYTAAIGDENLLLSKVASLWASSSLIMSSALKARGGVYFHFLQPNQYYSKKKFTEEEEKKALNNELSYSLLARKGYPALHEEIENLKNDNVNAFSAIGIFDKVKETIYIDECCHYNRLGNEKLADFIARCVLQIIKTPIKDY